MAPKPLCILVTGDPVPPTVERVGGFERLVRDGLARAWEQGFVVVDARSAPELPPLDAFAGTIVTGSAASVTERAPWMLQAEAHLAEAVRVEHPVLGICFGHQLLGQALGGLVERNPRGREMGTVRLELLKDDPILGGTAERPLAHATHVDSVTVLPPAAQVLARTELEPHAAVRFGARAWGVQFHPEFDAQVMSEYVETRRAALAEEGFDPGKVARDIQETTLGKLIFERFIEHGVRTPK